MNNDRRRFLKTSLLGSAAVVAGSACTTEVATEAKSEAWKPMSILILGGTGFIGPHMVREALRRGHEVSLFNRGRTNNELFPDLELLVGDRNNGLDALEGGKWDAVVDNSGYVPRHVEDSAKLLAPIVSHYLYVSTISVYGDLSQPIDEDTAVGTLADETVEEVTGETYGPMKAMCVKNGCFHKSVLIERLFYVRPTSADRVTVPIGSLTGRCALCTVEKCFGQVRLMTISRLSMSVILRISQLTAWSRKSSARSTR